VCPFTLDDAERGGRVLVLYLAFLPFLSSDGADELKVVRLLPRVGFSSFLSTS
jgi:hypothetical protein